MATYIGLLRGINLGNKNKVAMPRLREVCASPGYADVETYINSGNVIFDSDEPGESITTALEAVIAEHFGFQVPVVLLTCDELNVIVAANPYPEADDQPKQVHVGVLSAVLAPAAVASLAEHPTGDDEWSHIGRALYFRYRGPSHSSPLAKIPFERQLGVRVTTRNWATMRALEQRCAARA